MNKQSLNKAVMFAEQSWREQHLCGTFVRNGAFGTAALAKAALREALIAFYTYLPLPSQLAGE